MKTAAGWFSAFGLLVGVVAANWLTSTYGFVPVGLGFSATAGTFAFGFALALRDSTQDILGKRVMLSIVFVGAAISYLVSDQMIALASAVAFLFAELVNFAVYTPLRNKSVLGDSRWAAAVVSSSIAGAIIDTVIFLLIAFGWAAVTIPALVGQLIGKAYATVIYLIVGKVAAWFSISQTHVAKAK